MRNFPIFIIGIAMAIFSHGYSQEEKLTSLLSELITMKTVSEDKEANRKALIWVQEKVSTLPVYSKLYDFNGVPSLVITSQKTMHPKLFLVAHMDVVPGEDALFTAKKEGPLLKGRGAYDMKMAIACFILLLEELKTELPQLNIGVMLTADEEVGGPNGVKKLLEEGYSSDVALLPDGGFNWNLEEAAKGVLQLKIMAKGLSAHGSRPWLGDNAIEKLFSFHEELKAAFEKKKADHGDFYPTVNIGVIQGGKSTNQVPDYAEGKLDIRFPPGYSVEGLFKEIETKSREIPGISVEKIIEGSPHKQETDATPFLRFQEIAKEQFGIEVGTTKSHGASDARFFAEKKIPILVIAPRGGDIHSDGEWIDTEDLARFYQVIKLWAQEMAKQ